MQHNSLYWKKEYNNHFDRLVKGNDWKPFYNHGYAPMHGGNICAYDKEDSKWANQCNMYAHLLGMVDLTGKDVLEIGCGLGHGASVCKKYFPVNSVTAIDINDKNIEFAKNNFKGVCYEEGDATSLRYDEESFDVVLCVESSHCYRGEKDFYKGIRGVLKNDGVILITDIYDHNEDMNHSIFLDFGFRMISSKDVSSEVMKSCLVDGKTFRGKFKDVSKDAMNFIAELAERKYLDYKNLTHRYVSHALIKI